MRRVCLFAEHSLTQRCTDSRQIRAKKAEGRYETSLLSVIKPVCFHHNGSFCVQSRHAGDYREGDLNPAALFQADIIRLCGVAAGCVVQSVHIEPPETMLR